MVHILILLCALFYPEESDDFQIIIENIQDVKGTLYIAVYNHAEGFPEDEQWDNRYYEPVTSSTVVFTLPNWDQDKDYAIAVYQDVNDNGDMDKNWMGMPKEPFGFSNNVKPKWSAPSFEACKINTAEARDIKIRLIQKYP